MCTDAEPRGSEEVLEDHQIMSHPPRSSSKPPRYVQILTSPEAHLTFCGPCTFWPITGLLGLFTDPFSKRWKKNTKNHSQTLLGCGNSDPLNLKTCATRSFRAQMLTPHACLRTVLHPHFPPSSYGIASLVSLQPLSQLGVSQLVFKTFSKVGLKLDQFLKKKLSKNYHKS